jgi:hypothetical protein
MHRHYRVKTVSLDLAEDESIRVGLAEASWLFVVLGRDEMNCLGI